MKTASGTPTTAPIAPWDRLPRRPTMPVRSTLQAPSGPSACPAERTGKLSAPLAPLSASNSKSTSPHSPFHRKAPPQTKDVGHPSYEPDYQVPVVLQATQAKKPRGRHEIPPGPARCRAFSAARSRKQGLSARRRPLREDNHTGANCAVKCRSQGAPWVMRKPRRADALPATSSTTSPT